MSKLILILPRKISVRITKQLLLKPYRRKSVALANGMTQRSMTTPHGKIAVYQMGHGPVVLLSHGWSGSASQFFGLMDRLADAGYRAIAFDQLGHGQSDGEHGNLFLFIKTQQLLIQQIEKDQELKVIIAHSMGTATALNASGGPHPLLLIAPVFEFSKAMFEKVEQSGVVIQLLKNLLYQLELQHEMDFYACDPINKVESYQGDISIVHDKDDLFTPIEVSQFVTQSYSQVSLTETINLGHSRIIASDETWSAFLSLVKSEQSNASLIAVQATDHSLAS
jgi:esterase/lipase